MFSIGSTIKDREGNEWIVTQTWTYSRFLCIALIGATNGPLIGQMGGARFKGGDEMLIKR